MTLGAEYFDGVYTGRDDPWRLADRWYEARKRALTVAALPRGRFASALEIGCSIGTLTAELAPRCDALLAVDIATRAVELARERSATFDQVTVEQRDVSRDWPEGQRDLVVFSEVGYYFDRATLGDLAARAAASLTDDGVIVTCHWRHPVDDYPLEGDEARNILREASGLVTLARYLDDDFGLEVLVHTTHRSVATREGLVSINRVRRSSALQVLHARPAWDAGSSSSIDDI